MTALIEVLGRKNVVFISLTENDSEDNTASKLLHYARDLTRMGVPHALNISRELRGYPSSNPWQSIPHRMSYMANLRNSALHPLYHLEQSYQNLILMNDVVFHHTDVLKLVILAQSSTMACSLDMDGATLYDQWVLRDTCGRSTTGFWPFFMDSRDRSSVRKEEPLEVGVCWNGIVVVDADPFLNLSLRRGLKEDWPEEPLRFPQPPANCFLSECTHLPLILTNLSHTPKIMMDSSVIVGYTIDWWRWYAVFLRFPVIRLWRHVFENHWWRLWWLIFRDPLKWVGLDNGKERGECLVTTWPKCPESNFHWQPGALKYKKLVND